MNNTTIAAVIDARRKGSSIDEIVRFFDIDRATVFSLIRASKEMERMGHKEIIDPRAARI
jgi:uncharacterized protein (DUF433 family)